MASPTDEPITKATADALSKGAYAAEKTMKESSNTLGEGGKRSAAAIQDLTKAYQELAARNAKNLTSAMEAIAAVKSPAEFMELQQRLIKDSFEAAADDSRRIAELTSAVFAAAFEPVKKQFEAAQKLSNL